MSLRTTLDALFGSAWHVNHKNILDAMFPAADGSVEANKPVTADGDKDIVGVRQIWLGTNGSGGVAGGIDMQDGANPGATVLAAYDALRGIVPQEVAGGASITLDKTHNGATVKFDTAAGTAITLPAASGSGRRIRALVTVLATSNQHKVSAAGTDVFIGLIQGHRVDTGNAVLGFAAGATDNTITLNRTTTGSVSLGEWLEFEDVASGKWAVKGMLSATGAAFATPFSHV